MADGDWASLVNRQEQDIQKKMAGMNVGGDGAAGSRPAAAALSPASPVSQSAPSTTPSGSPSNDEKEENVVPKSDVSLINKLIRSNLVTTKNDIEVLRRDPKSPLHSAKTFEELRLKPELLKGVYSLGFNRPSKIQETALPALLAFPPSNLIAQSQSGTGKTAAFVLTMLTRVDISKPYPQCLCLAPTYELALQIGEVTKQMAKHMDGIRIKFAVRGESFERGSLLQDHIVIGTPGTAVDWSTRFRLIDPKKISVFVLDEADVMIDQQGHHDQSIRIQQCLSKDCQILLFSATYDEDVMKFANTIVPNPFIIRLRREEESLDNIKQYFIECCNVDEKFQALCNIYGTICIDQCIIFCQTKKTAAWLAHQLTKEGHKVALLTGELAVEQRAAVIKRFRDGKENVLITTNVSARGIDVENVTIVVNFDLPTDVNHQIDCDTYLHRIGRTGRFGKKGLAINMIDSPRSMAMLQQIEKHFNRKVTKLDSEDIDAIERIGK